MIAGDLKGGGSSRTELGGKGGPSEGAPPLPKEWLPEIIRVPTFKAGADRSPVGEGVTWEVRGQRERVGCVARCEGASLAFASQDE